MSKVNVRYIVNDVDAAIPFYTGMLDFKLDMHPAPGFASLSRGALQLLLNRPGAGGAGQALTDGQRPAILEAGTEFRSRSTTLKLLSKNSKELERDFVTRSSRATAASRSSSRIRRATRSSCSSLFDYG